MPAKPEAFSRVLIDQALRESGWDLLDDRRVRFELDGHSGRADYVLPGERGPLCVLEAKRPDLDPYDAKEQARGYAENLRAPFVILSNGKEHWFWNYERADQRDAFRIERLPSLADLERLRLKNLQPPRPPRSKEIKSLDGGISKGILKLFFHSSLSPLYESAPPNLPGRALCQHAVDRGFRCFFRMLHYGSYV